MKLKTEDKREIIRLRDEGMSISALAKKYHISQKNISLLIDRYKVHGEKILVKGKNRKFTPEFKLTVLNEYFDGASKRSLIIKYNLTHTMISTWLKRYEESGYNGLIDKKKGKPGKMKKEEVLKEENEGKEEEVDNKFLKRRIVELEAEVAYLKKLRALIQEREKHGSK